jgi:hypothetical protein
VFERQIDPALEQQGCEEKKNTQDDNNGHDNNRRGQYLDSKMDQGVNHGGWTTACFHFSASVLFTVMVQ